MLKRLCFWGGETDLIHPELGAIGDEQAGKNKRLL
jgi:hypothetical protein